jgi:hypothetical protein
LRSSGAAAEVRDVRHVDPVGDNESEDRITQHVAGDRDRHRPDPCNLAQLRTLDPAAPQRLHVDAKQRLIPGIHRPVTDPAPGLRPTGAAAIVAGQVVVPRRPV